MSTKVYVTVPVIIHGSTHCSVACSFLQNDTKYALYRCFLYDKSLKYDDENNTYNRCKKCIKHEQPR
jgi:hypothetical protein